MVQVTINIIYTIAKYILTHSATYISFAIVGTYLAKYISDYQNWLSPNRPTYYFQQTSQIMFGLKHNIGKLQLN